MQRWAFAAAWLALASGAVGAAQAAARAGAARGFRFVHLSDPHCARVAVNPRPHSFLDPHRMDLVHSFKILEAAVRQINADVRPDFAIITGDLVDRGRDLKSLRRVKAILDKLACPYYPVIGDHDRRETWRTVFGAARLNYTFTHGGWRFIAVDSSLGRLDGQTLAWLRGRLATDAKTPTALLIHRPLVVPAVYREAVKRFYGVRLLLENAAEALALLRKHPNVRAVFAGHCHVAIASQAHGTDHYVAPSVVEPGNQFHVVEVRGTALRIECSSVRR